MDKNRLYHILENQAYFNGNVVEFMNSCNATMDTLIKSNEKLTKDLIKQKRTTMKVAIMLIILGIDIIKLRKDINELTESKERKEEPNEC